MTVATKLPAYMKTDHDGFKTEFRADHDIL